MPYFPSCEAAYFVQADEHRLVSRGSLVCGDRYLLDKFNLRSTVFNKLFKMIAIIGKLLFRLLSLGDVVCCANQVARLAKTVAMNNCLSMNDSLFIVRPDYSVFDVDERIIIN